MLQTFISKILAMAAFTLLSASLCAQPLAPFELKYEARYEGFKASAERFLEILEDGRYRIHSNAHMSFLGKTLTRVREESIFHYEQNLLRPQRYEFIQSGFGKRSRRAEFDWQDKVALTEVDGEEKQLELFPAVLDELSAFLEITRQLALGKTDIYFQAIDDDEIKDYHYRLTDREALKSPLGLLNTLKVERIWEAGNPRKTELWFAEDWNLVLVKLHQVSGSGKDLDLNLKTAISDGKTVMPLTP
ncbi:MAG: DUF3108 domain-containing protein [Pseudomonadales bacterium]|nr:DUF3108 domain-containing protein [Pseudomonadales bacterium]